MYLRLTGDHDSVEMPARFAPSSVPPLQVAMPALRDRRAIVLSLGTKSSNGCAQPRTYSGSTPFSRLRWNEQDMARAQHRVKGDVAPQHAE